MPISPYLAELRSKVGTELLLLPAVAIVLRDEQGRLLLVRDREAGSWSLPAGAIEPAETPPAAALRELREETGLESPDLALEAALGGEAFRYTYPNGDRVEYQIFVYSGRIDSGEVVGATDEEEVAEVRFFVRSEAPPLALPYPAELLWRTS